MREYNGQPQGVLVTCGQARQQAEVSVKTKSSKGNQVLLVGWAVKGRLEY